MKTNTALLTTIAVIATALPFTTLAGTELDDISQLDSSATLLNVSGDFTITQRKQGVDPTANVAIEIQAANMTLTPLGQIYPNGGYQWLTRFSSSIWSNDGYDGYTKQFAQIGIVIEFDVPVSEFGWFIANNVGSGNYGPETATFFDSDGSVLYSKSYNTAFYKPDAILANAPSRYFIGYRSDAAPIKRLVKEGQFGTITPSIQNKVGFLETPQNEDPVADAGEDLTVEAVDAAGALVQLDGNASYDPDGDTLQFEWAVPSGSGAVLDDPTSATPTGQFPIGPTLVTLTVTDGNGGIDVCDVLVTVQDTTPPVLICTTDLIALWPPNHRIEPVQITIAFTDASSPEDLNLLCYITSSEPDDGTGDGSSIGDVDGFDGYAAPVPLVLTYDGANFVGAVDLRAERDGSEKGRDYSIVCEVVDASGNSATASCVVVVPHDKRKK